MYRYLKDYSYYSDFYDRMTIEECKRWDDSKYPNKPESETEEVYKIKEKNFQNVIIPMGLYFLTAELASKKSETIKKWVERDQEKDEKLENAIEPGGVRCLGCSRLLISCISRDLMTHAIGKEEVLFMFECEKCHKRRAYWENGTEWEPKLALCKECKGVMQSDSVKKENTIETTLSCPSCHFQEVDIFDLSVKEESIDPNFEANRKKYCISEQEGMKIMRESDEMKALVDKWKKRDEQKELYDEVAKIQKLTVSNLETLLAPKLEEAGYTKLVFDKPDFQKDVILGFGLQDAKSGRGDYDSRQQLKKLLQETLKLTNWRLMSDGVDYRLGFLQGRLRGVEGEENLKELIEKN